MQKDKKKLGIITYGLHCNFTNYGSALQTWALIRTIKKLGKDAILLNYCPNTLSHLNPLNPMQNMWDLDNETRAMCERSLPAIKENYKKYIEFYKKKIGLSRYRYNSKNFNESFKKEGINGYICGSDTIFSIREFKGFEDAFYSNYEIMKKNFSCAFAASFGDIDFTEEEFNTLCKKLKNFNKVALRERQFLNEINEKGNVQIDKVIDPTLLLAKEEYAEITSERIIREDYILLYSRRRNVNMDKFAEKLSKENHYKIIEISLWEENSQKNIMMYSAGIEEFLSLIKYAKIVVTNSYHGMLLSIIFNKEFFIFSRSLCNNKILEVLELLELEERLLTEETDLQNIKRIEYNVVNKIINKEKNKALQILKGYLDEC